jgi:hypothetical protein
MISTVGIQRKANLKDDFHNTVDGLTLGKWNYNWWSIGLPIFGGGVPSSSNLKFSGQLTLNMWYNSDTVNGDEAIENVKQHELVHAGYEVAWWNGMAAEVNPLEKMHKGACCKLAITLLDATFNYYRMKSSYDHAYFDQQEYGGGQELLTKLNVNEAKIEEAYFSAWAAYSMAGCGNK